MRGECDSCGYTTEIKLLKSEPSLAKKIYMCKICRETLIGNAYLWPKQYEASDVLRTIGWVANMLRDEIRRK